MGIYQPGDSVRIPFNTYDNTGTPADPATVRIYVRNAAGTWTTYTYGVDALLTKLAVGSYPLLVYIPNAAASTGEWKYEGAAVDVSANPLTVSVGGFEVGVSERLGTA